MPFCVGRPLLNSTFPTRASTLGGSLSFKGVSLPSSCAIAFPARRQTTMTVLNFKMRLLMASSALRSRKHNFKAWNSVVECPLCANSGHRHARQQLFQVALCLVVLARRPDLRCAYRLCHPVKDDYALAAAARRQRLLSVGEAAVDVLPVVHHPHVARG